MIIINTDIDHLNTALKGEYMAVQGFDEYILDAKSEEFKKSLQDIQSKHFNHIQRLTQRIQDLGGNPANSSGMIGVMAELKYKLGEKRYIDNDIKKTVKEAEQKGIDSYTKIIDKVEDTENQQLLRELMDDTKKIVSKLQ